METCGCRINYGVGKGGNTIEYCPMHKAAPKMYEALKNLVDRLDRGLALGEKLEMEPARQALAEAER